MPTQLRKILRLILLAAIALQANSQALAAESFNSPEWRYSVRPGDNLIQFSQRYLINPDDWHTLQSLNNVKNPNRLQTGSILRVPLSLVKQSAANASVALVSGQTNLLLADKSLQSVSLGQQLAAGAVLITGENSKLNIQFADGSVLSMGPNATLVLDTLSIYSGGGMVDTTVRLQQGRAEVQANPKHVQGNQMRVVTPSAVAAVRGTTFRVSADGEVTHQETLEGKVGLIAAAQEVPVDKGFGSLSEAGNPPLPPVLLLPAPATDALASKLDSVPVKFVMPAQTGAVAWLGKVSPDAQFSQIAAQKVSNGADLVFSDLPDGDYYLSVRAQDKLGIEGYDALHRFTLNARPFAPALTAPSQGQTLREATPELAWAATQEADGYELQIAKEADFKTLFATQHVSKNAYKLESALAPGQYFWRVASAAGADIGPFGQASAFTYKAKPPAPDISQLKTLVNVNQVTVSTLNPPEGLTYRAVLDNEKNQQRQVWQSAGLGGEFQFLLREYGKQTLHLQLVDDEGVAGPEAVVEFEASAP